MKALMLSGSRNPEGQTAQAVDAVLKGVAAAGGETERIFLPPLQIERCRQCDDNGWGPCRTAGRCVIQDDFLDLVAKIGEADVVIFATPVYYSDLSESLRVFTDRLRRVCTQESTRRAVKGKPAIAVCVAGGGGGGAPECCVSLNKVLTTCGFDVVDVIPVRRQNLQAKLARLELAGQWLASAPTSNP